MPETVVNTLELEVGETKRVSLRAINVLRQATAPASPITWDTDDALIASIVANDDEAAVTGEAVGETFITATDDDSFEATMTVVVKAAVSVSVPIDHLLITEIPGSASPGT